MCLGANAFLFLRLKLGIIDSVLYSYFEHDDTLVKFALCIDVAKSPLTFCRCLTVHRSYCLQMSSVSDSSKKVCTLFLEIFIPLPPASEAVFVRVGSLFLTLSEIIICAC